MSVNILPPRVFRLKADAVVLPHWGIPRTIPAGTLLWQHGTRASSMGSYIGNYSLTYRQVNGYSPKPGIEFQLKTDLVEAVA